MSNQPDIQRVKQIFADAAELASDQRDAFVVQACGDDEPLLAEVRAMLAAQADASAAGFLKHPLSDITLDPSTGAGEPMPSVLEGNLPTSEPEAAEIREGPGERIGPYKLLQIIGEGGFGSVFMAEQERPVVRRVALKIIKLGMDTRAVIARFEAERQALAIMDHAHIARVLDAGTTTTGRPYFVMELVKGEPITEYADRNHLNIAERIELFGQVCNAVQHAHQKGIIHRDIKPTNVLVSTQDDKPFAKVIDFGIAKAMAARLTEKTVFTEFKQMIGTPQYMSPEQAEGTLDIDTRTDVYSLGVLLYELLTGQTPFDAKSLRSAAYEEMRRIIREVDPPKPSTKLSESTETLPSIAAQRKIEPRKLTLEVRGELDWIVMRALEKDRGRRYPTPNDLAADLQRHLAGEPVEAAPPSLAYRAKKFTLRYRAAIVTFGALLILLLAAVFGTSFGLVREHKALAVAEVNRAAAIRASEQATAAKNDAEHETQLAVASRDEATRQAQLASKASLLSDARYLIQQAELPTALNRLEQADKLGLTYDDRLVYNEFLKASRDVWSLVYKVPCGGRPNYAAIVFPKDDADVCATVGNRLIVSSIGSTDRPETLQLQATPQQLLAVDGANPAALAVIFDAQIDLYLAGPLRRTVSRKFSSTIRRVTASSDSIAVAFQDKHIALLDARTLDDRETWDWNKLLESSGGQKSAAIRTCAISPDDRFLIVQSGPWTNPAAIIDRSDQSVRWQLIRMTVLAFDRSFPDKCFSLFEGHSGIERTELNQYRLPAGEWIGSAPSPNDETKDPLQLVVADDRMLSFGSTGVDISFSDQHTQTRYTSLWPTENADPRFLATDGHGRIAVLGTADGCELFLRNEGSIVSPPMDEWASCFTPTGAVLCNQQQQCLFYPFDLKSSVQTWSPQLLAGDKAHVWYPWGIHVTPDFRHMAIVDQCSDGLDTISNRYGQRVLLLYDLDRTSDYLHIQRQISVDTVGTATGFGPKDNRVVRLSPDGKTVLLGLVGGQVLRYDTATGRLLGQWQLSGQYETSADGSYLVGKRSGNGEYSIIRIADGNFVSTFGGIKSIDGGCFSEDVSQFLLASGGQLQAFDVKTGKNLWKRPSEMTPRGWSIAAGRFVGLFKEPASPDGKLMLAATDTGQPVAVLSKFGEVRGDCNFTADGKVIYLQRGRRQLDLIHVPEMNDVHGLLAEPAAWPTATWASTMPAMAASPATARSAAADGEWQNVKIRPDGVEGTVSAVLKTKTGKNVNFVLGPADTGILIFVPHEVADNLAKTLNIGWPEDLQGKTLRVRGPLSDYGGLSESLKGRRQITVSRAEDFEVVRAATPATTQSATQP